MTNKQTNLKDAFTQARSECKHQYTIHLLEWLEENNKRSHMPNIEYKKDIDESEQDVYCIENTVQLDGVTNPIDGIVENMIALVNSVTHSSFIGSGERKIQIGNIRVYQSGPQGEGECVTIRIPFKLKPQEASDVTVRARFIR